MGEFFNLWDNYSVTYHFFFFFHNTVTVISSATSCHLFLVYKLQNQIIKFAENWNETEQVAQDKGFLMFINLYRSQRLITKMNQNFSIATSWWVTWVQKKLLLNQVPSQLIWEYICMNHQGNNTYTPTHPKHPPHHFMPKRTINEYVMNIWLFCLCIFTPTTQSMKLMPKPMFELFVISQMLVMNGTVKHHYHLDGAVNFLLIFKEVLKCNRLIFLKTTPAIDTYLQSA